MMSGELTPGSKKSVMDDDSLSLPHPVRVTNNMDGRTFGADQSWKSRQWQLCVGHRFLKGSETRSSVGTCLIVFALPLLIPGVTLTCVAFTDETGFPKYSFLHVLGMVMLAGAGLFLVVGVALVIRIGYKVMPEYPESISSQSISTHHRPRSAGLKHQTTTGRDDARTVSVVDMESHHRTPPTMSPSDDVSVASAAVIRGATNAAFAPPTPDNKPPNNKTPLNFMIDHQAQAKPLKGVGVGVGTLPPITAAQAELVSRLQAVPKDALDSYYSSSDDDSYEPDSDDKSSGSYVISGENAAFHYSNEQIFHDNGIPETSVIAKPGPCRTSITPRSRLSLNLPQSLNFFHTDDSQNAGFKTGGKKLRTGKRSSVDILYPTHSTELSSEPSMKRDSSGILSNRQTNTNNDDSDNVNVKGGEKIWSPRVTLTNPSLSGSPRTRLEAFSNASALASSLDMRNSEELLPENIGAEMTESNGSVFTSGDDEVADGAKEDEIKNLKCSSADDVVHKKPPPLSSLKTFNFDFDMSTNSNSGNPMQTSGVIDSDSGSAAKDLQQHQDKYTASPKLVGILRNNLSSPALDKKSSEDHSAPNRHSINTTESAHFFSFEDCNRNSNGKEDVRVSPGNHHHHNNSNNSSPRYQLEPIPLKPKKKRATFDCGDEEDQPVKVTYYEKPLNSDSN